MQNEHDEQELTPAERELEAALRALRPAKPGLDPIALAFQAGAARQVPALWMWRAAAAVLAIALAVSIIASDRHRQTTTTTTTPARALAVQPQPSPAGQYFTMETRTTPSQWRLRDRVLDQGLDALVVPAHSPAAADAIPRASDITWRPS